MMIDVRYQTIWLIVINNNDLFLWYIKKYNYIDS